LQTIIMIASRPPQSHSAKAIPPQQASSASNLKFEQCEVMEHDRTDGYVSFRPSFNVTIDKVHISSIKQADGEALGPSTNLTGAVINVFKNPDDGSAEYYLGGTVGMTVVQRFIERTGVIEFFQSPYYGLLYFESNLRDMMHYKVLKLTSEHARLPAESFINSIVKVRYVENASCPISAVLVEYRPLSKTEVQSQASVPPAEESKSKVFRSPPMFETPFIPPPAMVSYQAFTSPPTVEASSMTFVQPPSMPSAQAYPQPPSMLSAQAYPQPPSMLSAQAYPQPPSMPSVHAYSQPPVQSTGFSLPPSAVQASSIADLDTFLVAVNSLVDYSVRLTEQHPEAGDFDCLMQISTLLEVAARSLPYAEKLKNCAQVVQSWRSLMERHQQETKQFRLASRAQFQEPPVSLASAEEFKSLPFEYKPYASPPISSLAVQAPIHASHPYQALAQPPPSFSSSSVPQPRPDLQPQSAPALAARGLSNASLPPPPMLSRSPAPQAEPAELILRLDSHKVVVVPSQIKRLSKFIEGQSKSSSEIAIPRISSDTLSAILEFCSLHMDHDVLGPSDTTFIERFSMSRLKNLSQAAFLLQMSSLLTLCKEHVMRTYPGTEFKQLGGHLGVPMEDEFVKATLGSRPKAQASGNLRQSHR
jgi:hypothetical protein